jgi:predicted metal-dependent phosphoesterase TrpH
LGSTVFKIDLHIHTTLGGDSDIEPEAVVSQARLVGLDGVCITEHHSYDLSAPFERIARRTRFPIFRGLEYRAAEGHLLIYGVRAGKSDLLPGMPMQTVVDWVNKRGGVAIPAHPYQSAFLGTALGDRVLQLTGLIAIETLNGSLKAEENQLAAAASRYMGLAGTGGSDAHGIHTLGSAYTCFAAPIQSELELVQALKSSTYCVETSGLHQARQHQ